MQTFAVIAVPSHVVRLISKISEYIKPGQIIVKYCKVLKKTERLSQVIRRESCNDVVVFFRAKSC